MAQSSLVVSEASTRDASARDASMQDSSAMEVGVFPSTSNPPGCAALDEGLASPLNTAVYEGGSIRVQVEIESHLGHVEMDTPPQEAWHCSLNSILSTHSGSDEQLCADRPPDQSPHAV